MESKELLLKCLICGLDNCSKEKLALESNENLISKNLHVIFLLRKVLEVPPEKLIVYLENSPDLDSWLSVCDKCEEVINNCKTIYEEILTAQRKFRKVKQEIIQSLNESPFVKREPISQDEDNSDVNLINRNIVEEIRGYVYQNDYPEVIDPFLFGDRLAYQQSQQLSLKLEEKVEDNDQVDNDNGDDDDNQSLTSSEDLQEDSDSDPESEEDEDMEGLSDVAPEPEDPLPQEIVTTEYKCDNCGGNSISQATLLHHQNNCTGISFPCPLAPTCLSRFIDCPSLLNHLCKVHSTDPNLPPQIKKLINDENLRITKLKLKCSKCGAVNSTKEALDQHKLKCWRIPRGKKLWTCPVDGCGEIFKSEFKVNVHLRRMHKELIKKDGDDGPSPIFNCETCGAEFGKKDKLSQHRRMNTKCKMMRGEWRVEDKVTCDICGKGYPSTRHVACHKMRVHEKRNGKKCEFCDIICEHQRELDRHLWSRHKVGGEIVDGVRLPPKGMLICGVEGCDVILRGVKGREKHLRRMHGERERKWGCDKCGKRYLSKTALQQHQKKFHDGDEVDREGGGGGWCVKEGDDGVSGRSENRLK